MKSLPERAYLYAKQAHGTQTRKYTGERYIVHPVAVAFTVARVPEASDEMIAAALLHDVVEDTPYTLDAIRYNFGDDVAYLVHHLTDVSKPEDGNRKERKKIDAAHNAAGDWRVHTIKVADLINNSQSIKEHDPNFWKVYRREKEFLLSVLVDADEDLVKEAYDWIMY